MDKKRGLVSSACAVLVVAVSPVARAQRAQYVKPEELRGEGLSHLADVATLGEYARVGGDVGGLRNIGVFALRSRLYLGRLPSYCLGLDGEVGGSNAGFAYGVTGYLTGVAARFGEGGVLSLCGGAGLNAIGSAVPLAARFPAELSVALPLGPLRPVVWLRPAWVAGSRARRHGTSLSFVDELDTGLMVRLSRQHRYWAHVTAGGGLALGVSYRQLMGAYAIVGSLGFDFVGEQ